MLLIGFFSFFLKWLFTTNGEEPSPTAKLGDSLWAQQCTSFHYAHWEPGTKQMIWGRDSQMTGMWDTSWRRYVMHHIEEKNEKHEVVKLAQGRTS